MRAIAEGVEECPMEDEVHDLLHHEGDSLLSVLHSPHQRQRIAPQQIPGIGKPLQQEEQLPILSIKRKKRTSVNLRKSLAWNAAFFTEEGVLDHDELSVVNRTFRMARDLPQQKNIAHNNFTGAKAKCSSVATESKKLDIISSPVNAIRKTNKRSQEHGNNTQGSHRMHGNSNLVQPVISNVNSTMDISTSNSPYAKRIESNAANGSSLMLPSLSSGKRPRDRIAEEQRVATTNQLKDRIANVELPNSPTRSLSSRVSSVSRKFKDTFGRVFTNRSSVRHGSSLATHDVRQNANAEDSTGSASRRFEPTPENNSSGTSLITAHNAVNGLIEQVPTKPSSIALKQESFQGISKAGVKESANVMDSSRQAKPSGLKKPSPKLGFFDLARATSAAHTQEITEGCNNGYKSGGIGGISEHKPPLLPHDTRHFSPAVVPTGTCETTMKIAKEKETRVIESEFGKGKNKKSSVAAGSKGNPALSAIPLPPHLRGKHVKTTVTLPRGPPTCPNARNSPYDQSFGKQPERGKLPNKNSQPVSSRENASNPSCEADSSKAGACFDPRKTTRYNSVGSHGLDSNTSSMIDARVPLSANDLNTLDETKKEKRSFFSFAKAAVRLASSPPPKLMSEQENGSGNEQHSLLQKLRRCKSFRSTSQVSMRREGFQKNLSVSPFSEERIRAVEEAGEELLQMKGGAVQHSPPNKSPPKIGPWSPVKRNLQLGPFDCTKHTNVGSKA